MFGGGIRSSRVYTAGHKERNSLEQYVSDLKGRIAHVDKHTNSFVIVMSNNNRSFNRTAAKVRGVHSIVHLYSRNPVDWWNPSHLRKEVHVVARCRQRA